MSHDFSFEGFDPRFHSTCNQSELHSLLSGSGPSWHAPPARDISDESLVDLTTEVSTVAEDVPDDFIFVAESSIKGKDVIFKRLSGVPVYAYHREYQNRDPTPWVCSCKKKDVRREYTLFPL